MTTCSVEGCEAKPHARGLCNKHVIRWRKYGDPLYLGPQGRPLKGDVPTLGAIHRRLYRTRGKATEFACVDCGGPARDWSYNNADPAQLTEERDGTPIAYSLDLDNYDPRCRSCHRKFDKAGDRPRTSRGTFA